MFKEKVSKIHDDDWVANIGAFLHMTNQLYHFRGPLMTISRRIIKVEERKLYLNQCGTARMYAKDNNKDTLINVLYVLELSVNLLLGKCLC